MLWVKKLNLKEAGVLKRISNKLLGNNGGVDLRLHYLKYNIDMLLKNMFCNEILMLV